MDEAFLLQLQEGSRSRALVLMGDFVHPDVCWESGAAGGRRYRRVLESLSSLQLHLQVLVLSALSPGAPSHNGLLFNPFSPNRHCGIQCILCCIDTELIRMTKVVVRQKL